MCACVFPDEANNANGQPAAGMLYGTFVFVGGLKVGSISVH